MLINFHTFLNFLKSKSLGINLYILGLWGILTGVALLGQEYPWPGVIQSIIFLVVLFAFVNYKPIRSLIYPIGLPYKLILLCMIALLYYSQLTKTKLFFPLIDFTMYSGTVRKEKIVYYEYEGLTNGGKKILINPTKLFPSLRHGRMSRKLHSLTSKAIVAKNQGQDFDEYIPKYNDTLIAIGNKYNLKNPSDPIRSMSVYKLSFNMNDYSGNSSIQRLLIWTLDVKN